MSPSDETSRVAEIAGFLVRFAPFQGLEDDRLEELAEHVGLGSFPAGTEILVQSGEPASHLFVIHGGAVDLLDEGRVVGQLGQGELFGISVFSGLGPVLTARAREETECYLIDPDRARSIMGSASGLAFLATQSARWREREVIEQHVLRAGIDDGVLGQIASARDVPGVTEAAGRLPAMVAALLDRGVDPVDIGHTVGTTIDHLTMRLIELFVDERGDPPAAFAWVALGSAARHEQALTTDQDHAIAYGDGVDPEAIDPYFADLAAGVTEGLEACGIERCRGNVMAVNPALRRTREAWRERFGEYIAELDPIGAHLTGIMFDYRRVTGAVDIEATLDAVIRSAGSDQAFLRRLARTVLESRAPVGRRGNIAVKRRGDHPGRIDIKHEGITIVTNLARIYAIMSSVTENRTIERLRRAATAGVITERVRDDLVEAFRLLWRIRLERHSELMQGGERADDLVDPGTLSPITARALGGSLRAIADAQELLGAELGIHHR
jgi:signal-transduction protein with cAMP-binding, CBS, and nucleotidyltransferase domain